MEGSAPQTYLIHDFLKWYEDGELILNPSFQRGSVWNVQARSYLIDSILRGYPVPKLLIRTSIDRDSRRTVRDVVDGQQRLKTIFDFSGGKFTLKANAKEFAGKSYNDLEGEFKDRFLSYPLTCEQLIGASDEDVLEVFIRINSYSVPVTPPELRNAVYDSPFASLVKEVVRAVGPIWSLGPISERDRVRMVDQSLVAEVISFLDRGIFPGGESKITKYYDLVKTRDFESLPRLGTILNLMEESAELLNDLKSEPLVRHPHLVIFLAALMYKHEMLPAGKIELTILPPRESMNISSEKTIESLKSLNLLFQQPDHPSLSDLRQALTSTHQMKSRQVRLQYFCRALTGEFSY